MLEVLRRCQREVFSHRRMEKVSSVRRRLEEHEITHKQQYHDMVHGK